MWAHYGDAHKGIVMAVDGESLLFNQSYYGVCDSDDGIKKGYYRLHHVSYRTQRHQFDGEGTFIDSLCCKSIHWSYEEEVRFVIDRSRECAHISNGDVEGVSLCEIPVGVIRGFLFGACIDGEEIDRCKDVIRGNELFSNEPVMFHKITIDKQAYALNVVEA
jgi:hypothetical protein